MAAVERHPGTFGLRRPSRAVSLPSPELQRAGFGVFNWGGYGNPPEIWTRGPGGPEWNITSNAEARRFLEAAAEQMRKDGRDDAPPPGTSLEEVVGPVYDYLGRSPRHIALPEEGGITDNVPEPGEGEAVDPEHDPEPVYEPQPDRGPMLMTGAGQQSLPGMEPPRPGRLTPEQIALGREWLPKVRRTLEEGLAPQPPDHLDNFNPQSQMSQQYLADRFAQQRAQPQHGYFGGTGAAIGGMAGGVNKAVQGMSNADRIALVSLLLAGGAAATGIGSPLVPLIVGGGAALSGQP